MESSARIRFVLAGTVKQAQRLPHAGIAHLVERHLAKVEVASSSLVARSSLKNAKVYALVFFLFY